MDTQPWDPDEGEPEYVFSGLRCLYCGDPVPDGYQCAKRPCLEADDRARNRMGVGWMDDLGIE